MSLTARLRRLIVFALMRDIRCTCTETYECLRCELLFVLSVEWQAEHEEVLRITQNFKEKE